MARYKKKMSFLTMLVTAVIISASLVMALDPLLKYLYPLNYREKIEEISSQYELDPYLVMGIISAESGFKEDAQSHKSAHGLMQLKDETALWCVENLSLDIAEDDIRKPESNILIGCAYMRYLVDLYEGNTYTAIAAYNAGLGNVNDWLNDKRYSDGSTTLTSIPFAETDAYVKKVRKRAQLYKKLYGYEH